MSNVKKKVSIKHKLDDVKEALTLVFSKPLYVFLAILIAFLIFSLFIFLTNIPIFLQALSVVGPVIFPKIALNIINTILIVSGPLALSLMIVNAVVGGVTISMIIFKFATLRKAGGNNLVSIGGIVGSAFGVGCPACSTSLLSILGVSGGLSILPFKGIEFTFTGLVILLVSLYFIAKSISYCEVCKIQK